MLKAPGAELCQNVCGVVNEQKIFCFISVVQSAQLINSERIHPQTRVSSFPGPISVARVNEYRTTDITRLFKAPGADICQNGCGVVNEQKIFCSYQCSSESSMNKFRAYISTDTCFVLPRTHQCGSGYILYIYNSIFIIITK